jgi:hypothetical protein
MTKILRIVNKPGQHAGAVSWTEPHPNQHAPDTPCVNETSCDPPNLHFDLIIQ